MSNEKVVNEEASRAEAESLRFLQSHLDYAADPADNKKLADYIKDRNLPWTVASLQEAYDALSSELRHRSADEVSARAKALTQQLSNPQPSEFPWGALTKKSINRMRPEDMKRFLKDPRFAEQLDAALRRK